ncbi:hypothetical protein OF83DRAFT_1175656 [Amylostereum chailletii]|nr:hypothetical protein OF83DRAFT_1175656 [Amylostereum chailletii]
MLKTTIPQLPIELQLYILQLATNVHRFLEIIPSADDTFSSGVDERTDVDSLIEDFFESLPTRRALPLVSRSFRALATPFLYACMLFDRVSTPRIYSSLTLDNTRLVHHVIVDLSAHYQTRSEHLVGLTFPHLYFVRILTVRGVWHAEGLLPYPLFSNADLAHTMASSFGPSLRKLELHRYGITLFYAAHLSIFTASLVKIEVLVVSVMPCLYKESNIPLALPTSLPRLRYVRIGEAPLALPAGIAPAHVHHPTLNLFPRVITPSLTHLSLRLLDELPPKAYTSILSTALHLVSLTLTGSVGDVTRVLTDYPLPAFSRLIFGYVYEEDGNSGEKAKHTQVWVNAVGALGVKQPAVTVVSILDDDFVGEIGRWVKDGMGVLEKYAFALEGRDGRGLVGRIHATGVALQVPYEGEEEEIF